MIFIFFILSLSFPYESFDILNSLNNDLEWNFYNQNNNKKIYQSNEILDGIIITKIEQKVKFEAETIMSVLLNINLYNDIISNKNLSTYLDSTVNDSIYVYQKITNVIPFIRDRQYVFKMFKVDNNKINWIILKENEQTVKKYLDAGINTLTYGAGSWEIINENILVNIIYVDDEVNLPFKLVQKIRINNVVAVFDDILNYLNENYIGDE